MKPSYCGGSGESHMVGTSTPHFRAISPEIITPHIFKSHLINLQIQKIVFPFRKYDLSTSIVIAIQLDNDHCQ